MTAFATAIVLVTLVTTCFAQHGFKGPDFFRRQFSTRRGERIIVRYTGLILPSIGQSGAGETPTPRATAGPTGLVAGQEARFRVTLVADTQGSNWATMYFNATAGSAKVRIIPAYSNRGDGSSGERIKCNMHSDYWQEYWGLTSARYLWGSAMVQQGFITFTVPPFPYRMCLQAEASYRNVTTFNETLQQTNPYRALKLGARAIGKPRQRVIIERFFLINSTYEKGDTSQGVWSEFNGLETSVQWVNSSAHYVFKSSTNMFPGDFAAIKIMQNGFRHELFVPAKNTLNSGDYVKLVKGGLPCTYENIHIRDYCGSNHLQGTGIDVVKQKKRYALTIECIREGAIKHGVLRVGSNQLNPYGMGARASYPVETLTLSAIRGGKDLVAYAELPSAGTYDICFSPRALRTGNHTTYNTPVWYKIFNGNVDTCNVNPNERKKCYPKGRLIVSSNTFSQSYQAKSTVPGSWGQIRIYTTQASGSGPTAFQSTMKATVWEYSKPREFFNTLGGDQFRLVSNNHFTNTPQGRIGDMNLRTIAYALRGQVAPTQTYTDFSRMEATTATEYGAAADRTTIRAIGKPDLGSEFTLTTNGGGGCWNHLSDNYGAYTTGLNGISSEMLQQCCNGTACHTMPSSRGCSMSDKDNEGVTASGDLGGDPRASIYAWTSNAASQTEAWAYIRFPSSAQRWDVCYRRAGVENWRRIPRKPFDNPAGADLPSFMDVLDIKDHFYTYYINDTQAQTWGPLFVRDRNKTLTTQRSNYVGSGTVVGSQVKVVKNTESCYTSLGEYETWNSNPGLQECDVGVCSASGTQCDAQKCLGQADDSSVERTEVAFYIRMPTPRASNEYYRVCFKNKDESWIQLRNPTFFKHLGMDNPWKFNTLPAPQLSFTLRDVREGTWGKFIFTRLSHALTQPFNLGPNNAFRAGDVVRLVPNRTTNKNDLVHCDVTWGASASANGAWAVAQTFSPQLTSLDLGLYCVATVRNPSTDRCFAPTYDEKQLITPAASAINPIDSISGDIGNFPYNNLDSTSNLEHVSDLKHGAVAFITIPPQIASAGYRVCYKPLGSNWIDGLQSGWSGGVRNGALNPFRVGAAPTNTFTIMGPVGSLSTIWAGQYAYIRIQGGTIDLDKDLVKLVLNTVGCDRPAAGQLSAGNQYGSFSLRRLRTNRSFAVSTLYLDDGMVATSSATRLGIRGSAQAARAYMTFPVVAGLAQQVTSYKVCYMTRFTMTALSDTQNWQNLGTIQVQSPGIVFTAETAPFIGGVLGIRFLSSRYIMLNTLPKGDAAKLVSISSPCFGGEWQAADRPSGTTSLHVGQDTSKEQRGVSTDDTTLLETGIDELGESNQLSTDMSRMEVTLPWAPAGTYYKVCYRPVGKPWMEVNQAPQANEVFPLGAEQIKLVDTNLNYYTIESNILGNVPGTNINYQGGSYAKLVIGGASTGGTTGTSNTSYLYVTYKADFDGYANDMFKLVKYANEVTRGVYVNIPRINCNSNGITTARPWTDATSTSGNPRRSSFGTNIPTIGGRYLLCYRKSGLTIWVQLQNDPSTPANPFTVIPNSLSFLYNSATKTFSVTDLFSARVSGSQIDVSLSAMTPNDRVYLASASQSCGFIPANPTTFPLNGTGFSTSSLIAPTAAGYYKLCYQRASISTSSTGVQSFTKTNWYQIENGGASTNGGGTPFFVTTTAKRLKIANCPNFTASNPLRSGDPISIDVQVLDTNDTMLPFSLGTWAYRITAVDAAQPTNPTFKMTNTGGECRSITAPQYGLNADNLLQWTSTGMVTFKLAIVSGCPGGSCAITFSASDNIQGPGSDNGMQQQCTVFVQTTSVNTLNVVSADVTSCKLDESCKISLAAYSIDNELAHTNTDDVLMAATAIEGLGVKANAVQNLGASGQKVGSLANGLFDVVVVFDATNGLLFSANRQVTLVFIAGGRNTSWNINVIRPSLAKMVIVDLFPESVNTNNLDDNDKFIKPQMVPSWVPNLQQYSPPPDRTVPTNGEISAASNYYLVALQTYTAVLRAVDQNGQFITKDTLFTKLHPTTTYYNITIEGSNTDAAAATRFTGNNRILQSCNTDEVCSRPFAGILLVTAKQTVQFVIANGMGCEKDTPCKLTFKFNNIDLANWVTSITTPVRSMARKLRVTCWKSIVAGGILNEAATTDQLGTALTPSAQGACSGSTSVELGFTLKVEAVDDKDRVDEFFSGNVLPLLQGGNGRMTPNGISITTVKALRIGGPAQNATKITDGVGMIYGLTLSRPCTSECVVQLATDWGTELYNLGRLSVAKSTTTISCKLTNALFACVVNANGECESISGVFGYVADMNQNKVSLIYKDTQLCATVEAVNEQGMPTLYETNWVMYWAQAVAVTSNGTINPVTVTNSGSAGSSRVRAMVRSSVSFCFTVNSAGAKANFNLRFAAQRYNDATYWAKNANGECTLGTFTFWGTKHIANLGITKVTDPMMSLTTLPAASIDLYGQRKDAATDLSTTLTFGLVDHYSKPIAPIEVVNKDCIVVISSCGVNDTDTTKLVSTCTSSTTGILLSPTPSSNQREGGLVTATLTSSSIAVKGEISYSLNFEKWCLGCSLSFKVKKGSADYVTKISSGDYTPTANVNLYIAIQPSADRVLAFRIGTSPIPAAWTNNANSNSFGSTTLGTTECFTTKKTRQHATRLRPRFNPPCVTSGPQGIRTA